MFKATLYLTILTAGLAVCWAKPADVFARIPSSYYKGTKWVLFRDNNIANPPPNYNQADSNVQVLPNNDYPQQKQFVDYFDFVIPALGHGGSSIKGDHDTEIVESSDSGSFLPQHPHLDFGHLFGDFQKSVKHQISQTIPNVKVVPAEVAAIPPSSITVQGPAYIDYLRKKKNV